MTRYTHRILAALALEAALNASATTNITFFGISDMHYGQSSAVKDTARNRMPRLLNTLPGKAWPAEVGGGTVDTPRAVLVAGDLTEKIDTALWTAYTNDYGVFGEKKVKFPTYEACGNHEFYTTGTIKDTLYNVNKMIQRNIARRGTFTDMDSTGYHYSWDWEGVHFINLNLYAGSTELGYSGYRPLKAREFLAKDLAANVGTSGRPVFIMQHYMMRANTSADWTDLMKSDVYAILQSYNIIGILHGHSHSKQIYKWNGIDVFDDGTVMNGEMMAFHITDGHFVAANRVDSAWGTLTLSKDISMGKAASLRQRPRSAAFRHMLFSVPEAGIHHEIPVGVQRIEILDIKGRIIQVVPVAGTKAEWNRMDAKGRRVSSGVYFLRDATHRSFLGTLALR